MDVKKLWYVMTENNVLYDRRNLGTRLYNRRIHVFFKLFTSYFKGICKKNTTINRKIWGKKKEFYFIKNKKNLFIIKKTF